MSKVDFKATFFFSSINKIQVPISSLLTVDVIIDIPIPTSGQL